MERSGKWNIERAEEEFRKICDKISPPETKHLEKESIEVFIAVGLYIHKKPKDLIETK